MGAKGESRQHREGKERGSMSVMQGGRAAKRKIGNKRYREEREGKIRPVRVISMKEEA